MLQRGLPAVIVISEQFATLARALMKSRDIPESIAIVIGGNPEFPRPGEEELTIRQVIGQSLGKLTGAADAAPGKATQG